ncbi:exported hypothetical protein [Cupriavidus necator]|uniref:Uncharacterized protein n=1 Tax=Cupriavidus necator TaxID=106590 RepID=A0A1K0J7V1_CUPNE|nr:exported hypothetical protein [Cupriavidus necator]
MAGSGSWRPSASSSCSNTSTGGMPSSSCSADSLPRWRRMSSSSTVRCQASRVYSSTGCASAANGLASMGMPVAVEVTVLSCGRTARSRAVIPLPWLAPRRRIRALGGAAGVTHVALQQKQAYQPLPPAATHGWVARKAAPLAGRPVIDTKESSPILARGALRIAAIAHPRARPAPGSTQ